MAVIGIFIALELAMMGFILILVLLNGFAIRHMGEDFMESLVGDDDDAETDMDTRKKG